MHRSGEFLGQCCIYHAMALDPALPFERQQTQYKPENASRRLAYGRQGFSSQL